jgi:hypothetical protein
LTTQPFLITNRQTYVGPGLVGFTYHRARNVDTHSGRRVTAPIPAGLSGCPMFDAYRMSKGQLKLLGLFTDYAAERGRAFGEDAPRVREMLQNL